MEGMLAALGQDLLTLLPTYGYVVLAGAALAGAAGLPIPVTLLLLAAGALAADGTLGFVPAVATALAGAVAGDCAGYWLGRAAGRPLLERAGRRVGIDAAHLAATERAFARWGGSMVWLSRWLATATGPAVNLLAGANRYRFALFLACDVAGELVWSAGYTGLGWLFGDNWSELVDLVQSFGGLALAATGAILAGLLLWRLSFGFGGAAAHPVPADPAGSAGPLGDPAAGAIPPEAAPHRAGGDAPPDVSAAIGGE